MSYRGNNFLVQLFFSVENYNSGCQLKCMENNTGCLLKKKKCAFIVVDYSWLIILSLKPVVIHKNIFSTNLIKHFMRYSLFSDVTQGRFVVSY